MLRKRLSKPGFIMAETMVALSILVTAIVFWGSTEVVMQHREREGLQKIEKARQAYTQKQQRLYSVTKHAK